MESNSDSKRVAKNSLLLYMRMFVLMGIGLFTSRIILNALGVEDYGIYNVVGGFVSMWVCQLNCVTLDCQELLGDNPKRLFLGKLGQGSMPCQSFSTLVA